MFKKIAIIMSVIAFLLTAFYGITLLKNRGTETIPPDTNQGVAPLSPTTTPDGSGLFLPTQDPNTPLIVPNVFSDTPAVEPLRIIEDTVSGSKTAVLAEEESYSLYGFTGADGASFMVALHADNLRQARIDGEQRLLDILGISRQQACTTNITVVVQSPYNANIEVSDVRPSFCPDRVDLPTEGAGEGLSGESVNSTPADTQL